MPACARFMAVLLLMSIGTLTAGRADAHALLLSSVPAAGATVEGAALDITLNYNSRVDASRSRLMLKDGSDAGQPLSVEGDESPATLHSHAANLKPGKFLLHWEVLSVDGHISRGDVPFTVQVP